MKKTMYRLCYVLIAFLFVSQNSFATDGYFTTGYGTISKGLAGAGIAFYEGSLINGNPAATVFLGKQYQIGVDFFNPNRQYTIGGTPAQDAMFPLASGTVKSDSKLFLIPSIGANWMLSEKSSISATLFGNGGMNTDYPTMTFGDQSSKTTGVNLAQLFGNFTYAQKLGEKHSIGLTGVVSYQYFEAKGLSSFGEFGLSSNPAALSGNGTDSGIGFGFKVGYYGQLTDNFSVGVTYQSKVYMSEFDEYAGLFAEQGDFDIPSSWTAGISWEFVSDLTFVADVKRICYNKIGSIGNPMMPNMYNAMTGDASYLLGAKNGAGFGWDNIMIYKVGLNYAGIDTWEFRCGASFGKNPVPESEVMFNILAPGVIENQVALGVSKAVGSKGNKIHVAMNYAMNSSVKGQNPMAQGQTIEVEMNQFELELGFSF